MKDNGKGPFSSPEGKRFFERFCQSIEREGLGTLLSQGVTVALSGGADSVLLLSLLAEYRRRTEPFVLVALHVHHGIRTDEADRDAAFCEQLCDSLGVPCTVSHFDVPSYAREHGLGLEEAAREVRYTALRAHARAVGTPYIVTAHHATDQLETVLLHMLRGSGAQGLCGMFPIAGDVLRPLLTFSREQILSCLKDEKIAYMQDSTNDSCEYMRNYIRLCILPQLSHVTPSPERSITRMTRSLQEDARCLDRIADTVYAELSPTFAPERLAHLDKAILARVLFRMVREHTPTHPEAVHVDALCQCLGKGEPFSLSLSGGVTLVSDGKSVRIRPLNEGRNESLAASDAVYPLSYGMNVFEEHGFSIYLSEKKETVASSNVYKFSIHADLSSAIIKGALRLRFRREGDAYFYGGMTHRVKRLLCDRHIPAEARRVLPVISDERGILWIPGFGVREDKKRGEAQGPFVSFFAHSAFPMD